MGLHVTLLGPMDFWINKENGRLLLPTCLLPFPSYSGMYHQVCQAGNAKGKKGLLGSPGMDSDVMVMT